MRVALGVIDGESVTARHGGTNRSHPRLRVLHSAHMARAAHIAEAVEPPREFHFDADLAARFGTSQSTLRRWLGKERPGVPRDTRKVGRNLRGGWELSEADLTWLAEKAGMSESGSAEGDHRGHDPMVNGKKVCEDGLSEGWAIAMSAYIRKVDEAAEYRGRWLALREQVLHDEGRRP